MFQNLSFYLSNFKHFRNNVLVFILNCHKLNAHSPFLRIPLSGLGLWSDSSLNPGNPAALATAALCKSSVALAKTLKPSNSSPFSPGQNRTGSEYHTEFPHTTHSQIGELQWWHDLCSQSYQERNKQIKKLQLLPKIIKLCTAMETSRTVISKENSSELVLL